MRCHIVLPQIGDQPRHVVGLVGAECDPVITGTRRHHLEPGLALRRAGCQTQTRVDHQSVPVLHQNVPHIGEFGRLARPFAIPPRVGVGGRGVPLVALFLAVEVPFLRFSP
jgi:hypothetical protein